MTRGKAREARKTHLSLKLIADLSFSENSSVCVCVCVCVYVCVCAQLRQTLATPQTVAHQTPPSMEFSRQEYWSG